MRLYMSDDSLQRGAVGTRTSRHRGSGALHVTVRAAVNDLL